VRLAHGAAANLGRNEKPATAVIFVTLGAKGSITGLGRPAKEEVAKKHPEACMSQGGSGPYAASGRFGAQNDPEGSVRANSKGSESMNP
jgi:hypothetical protein